ncbi:Beige/BEACH domain containing protein [Tritrichomonas foetus]|uniref:Beige/BEACH domain containing protein n=1 Tax=Tritrichomonas foetus TaxID=1144522 RepID=A0A1J4J5S7_9EUKA|nr:Beige/BEACH domain containing protein [Tritrichomonas foetus]|eukprot:OHS93003.1 Beige/BEACH domain containing protein [Tritrichomonas foetus]
MLQLVPEYFPPTKIPVTPFILENCITTFCIENDPDSPQLLYDSSFTHEVMIMNSNMSQMEVISVLFDFNDLLKTIVNESSPITAMRKLYAISFYLNQFFKQSDNSFLEEMKHVCEITFSVFKSRPEMVQLAGASFSFALTMLSSKCRDNNPKISLDDDVFLSILSMALEITKIPDALNFHTTQSFQVFFLSVFYLYCPNSTLTERTQNLFLDLLNVIDFSVNCDFNYLSLCNRLISFLNDPNYPRTLQIETYALLANISIKMEELAEFLFDNESLKQYSNFLNRATNVSDANYKSIPYKRYIDVKSADIPLNEIITAKTFEKPYVPSPTIDYIPDGKSQFLSDKFLSKLFESTFTLCNSNLDKRLETHIKFMKTVFRLENKSNSMLVFISIWFKKFMLMDPDEAYSSLGDFNILHQMLDLATSDSSLLSEYIKNINETLVFMVKNCQRSDFIFEIFTKFEEDALSLSINSSFINFMDQCASADQVKILTIMKHLNFDQIFTNLLLTLRSDHASTENPPEIVSAIERSRSNLFVFITKIFQYDSLKKYFVSSVVFIETLCQMIFEPNVSDFVLCVIGDVIISLKSSDSQLHEIILFFQKQFCKTDEPSHILLSQKILKSVVGYFSRNPNECAIVFLNTSFFQTLDEFVCFTKSNDDLFCLFHIFQDCSSIDDQTKDYLLDLNPFQSLAPVIESQIMNDDIKNKLWSIVCGVECTFMDHVRVLKNSAPLALLFRAMKRSRETLTQFLAFIRQCCEKGLNTALEVNYGEFPSLLIDIIHEYRNHEQSDDLFEETVSLLSVLAQNSMKSKDLLSMFQSLTLLPNNKRPFFTVKVLQCLLQIFNSNNHGAPSFLRSYNKKPLITFPKIPLQEPITEFSIFMDVKFKRFGQRGTCEIFYIKTHDFTIGFWLTSNHFYLTIQKQNLTFQKVVPIEFEMEKWIQIAFIFSKQLFTIYIDGINKFDLKIPIIELNTKIISCFCIKNIWCCISSFYFFSHGYDIRYVKMMSRLPKTSATTFQNYEKDEFPQYCRSLFTGELSECAVYLYHAGAKYSKNLPNLAIKYSGYPAIFSGHSFNYLPQPKYMLHCVGGIPTLFPFFAQLDQPFCQELLPTLISLIAASFNNCAVNQEEFYQINGFQVIAYLITCSKLSNISIEFIDKLIELLKSVDYRGLVKQMYSFLFFDVQIWIYLPIDRQVYLYEKVIKIFNEMTIDTKKMIVSSLRFHDLLMMMRVCLWTKPCYPEICLFDKPKIDKNTKEIEAERPSDVSVIRKHFWHFAKLISDVIFTKRDAVTLCFCSFEVRDIELCVETLKMLILLIRKRTGPLIETLTKMFNFEEFFPLLLTINETLRVKCMHIFYQFSQNDLIHLLEPYTIEEWIDIICLYINNKNISTVFADTIFGYMFGLFTPGGKLTIKISVTPLENHSPIFSMVQLLPLALMSMSEMNESVASNYAMWLDKAIRVNQNSICILKLKDWYHHFMNLFISRSKNGKIDEPCSLLLNALASLYVDSGMSYPKDYALFNTNVFMNIYSLEKFINGDVNHLFGIFLTQILDNFLLKKIVPDTIVNSYVNIIFNYLFFIPESDVYYNPQFGDVSQSHFNISYQQLWKYRLKGEKISIIFAYGTRTSKDGRWVDAQLAERFCQLFTLFPSINDDSDLFSFSFTLGIGLSHIDDFHMFSKHIRALTAYLPNIDKPTEQQMKIFMNFFSGLVKTYLKTGTEHESHAYLFEFTKIFPNIISELFNYDVNWGDTFVSFEENFINNGHHFAYQAIEQFSSEIEISLDQQAISHGKSITKEYSDSVDSRKNYEKPNSAEHIMKINKQVIIQLRKYATDVKHSKSKGLKKYVGIWRILSSERGPWRQPELKENHHWKLDKSNQNHLTRGLMTENFNFNDHKDASLMREAGNPSNAAEEYQSHLKQLRITDFAGDKTVLALFDTNEIDESEKRRINNDVIIALDAKLVTLKSVTSGTFLLTNDMVIFDSPKYIEIELDTIRSIFLRRYLLMDTSIEIFATNHLSYFFDFVEGQRDQLIKEFVKLKLKNMIFIQKTYDCINPLLSKTQKQWMDGKMSNFEYLMSINTFAGRTYNDLAQYPVFPWILSDYTSDTLDLDDPNNYRDLSIPIGAYCKERLDQMVERMEASEGKANHYLYGSFYSSAAVVIGFMIRVEPFTSLHIKLQSGRFDIPDRLFQSIPRTWNSVKTLSMDFRELIPEFFFFPDFLVNSNHFDLGPKINDVELPRWAKSPRDFVDKNRIALESPFVTRALPRWIDMIFGITSRGEPCYKIYNIFNPLFFPEGIAEDVKGNEDRKIFRTEFAACFGQAPQQLFKERHPKRPKMQRKLKPADSSTIFDCTSPVLSMEVNGAKIIVINSQFELFTFDVDGKQTSPKEQLPNSVPISEDDVIPMTKLVRTFQGTVLFSTLWDISFSLYKIGEGIKHVKRMNVKNVSALAISEHRYITGSQDSTVMIWKNDIENIQIPLTILFKHKSTVNSVDINEICNIAVSSSRDGSIVTTSLMSGEFIKLITIQDGDPISVKVANSGTICVGIVKADKSLVKAYDINLNEIREHLFESRIVCWKIFEWYDGSEYLVVAMKNNSVSIISLPFFENVWHAETVDFNVSVIQVMEKPKTLLMGTLFGKVIAIKLEELQILSDEK